MSVRRPYRSDVSDARWALIEPVFTAWRAGRTGPGTAARVHDLREIVNAILYVNRTGIPWEYLPHDFPPYKTVYDYYASGKPTAPPSRSTTCCATRRAESRAVRAQPTAGVVDAQSVKTSANVPVASQGIDAGKKIIGRKRHLVTDTLGLRPGRHRHRRQRARHHRRQAPARRSWPPHIPAWPRSGPTAATRTSVINHGAGLGIDVEVVQRPRAKGFEPLPKRWVIERTFGWLMQHRRLARDYEALPQRSRAMIHWAMANKMSRELTGESVPTWRIETGHPAHIRLNTDQMPRGPALLGQRC